MPPPLLKNFGCRLNAYESEVMKTLAQKAGIEDVVIVNSCAVTGEAVRQVEQTIRRLAREDPDRQVIVTGCAAQTEIQRFAEMAGVDVVVGNAEKMQQSTWDKIAKANGQIPKIIASDIMQTHDLGAAKIDGLLGRARAYVQVQNGCDHRCTFCIIPYGRGPSRSQPVHEIIDQIKRLRDRGFLEIVLTGVDMTSWGADLESAPRLGILVERILREIPDLPRLRISSIDSVEIDPLLFDIIVTEKRFMPHLHLSLQSGDTLILKRMKRRHSREDSIQMCAELLEKRPEIALGADLIAGFPTETEAMFENSYSLIEACHLVHTHVFPFSPREGTPAARMPQLPRAIIKARADRLRQEADRRKTRFLQSLIGQTLAVLVEGKDKARAENYAEIAYTGSVAIGAVDEVTITGVQDGQLIM